MKTLLSVIALMISVAAHADLPIESLYGYFKTNNGIAIQVHSGGCTTKASFNVQKIHNRNVEEIYFIRNRPDYCKAYLKNGIVLAFTYSELGLAEGEYFKIMNPVNDTHYVW